MTALNQKLYQFYSGSCHPPDQFPWQPLIGSHSISGNTAYLLPRKTLHSQLNLIMALAQPHHLHQYWLTVGLKPIYFLRAWDSDKSTITGAAVLSLDSLCPPFDSAPNPNIFCSRFGIEFHAADHTHIHAVSPFEFTSCFGLNDQLRYRLAQHVNWYALDGGIPALTSAWIFDHILK